jgi:hypothetical protein
MFGLLRLFVVLMGLLFASLPLRLALAQQPAAPQSCETQLTALQTALSGTYTGLLRDGLLPQGVAPAPPAVTMVDTMERQFRVGYRQRMLEQDRAQQETSNVVHLMEQTRKLQEQLADLRRQLETKNGAGGDAQTPAAPAASQQ